MSSLTISLIVFACVFGSALLGFFVRRFLPEHHLASESKEVVRLGMALVGSIVALVLGLLTASAKGYFDTQSTELIQLSANVVMLDRALTHYGPETKEERALLRGIVTRMLAAHRGSGPSDLALAGVGAEGLFDRILALSPANDHQRTLKAQALGLTIETGRIRWLIIEQNAAAVPLPLVAMLALWLALIFASFGLFVSPNATVITSLCLSALAVSGAVLMILDFYTPYAGLIQVSVDPLRAALAHLGQ
jgi:hypothetical protein